MKNKGKNDVGFQIRGISFTEEGIFLFVFNF